VGIEHGTRKKIACRPADHVCSWSARPAVSRRKRNRRRRGECSHDKQCDISTFRREPRSAEYDNPRDCRSRMARAGAAQAPHEYSDLSCSRHFPGMCIPTQNDDRNDYHHSQHSDDNPCPESGLIVRHLTDISRPPWTQRGSIATRSATAVADRSIRQSHTPSGRRP
jgi:hypothetical protein